MKKKKVNNETQNDPNVADSCYNTFEDKNIENLITNLDEMPLVLNVSEVAKILRLSKANTYELCHSKGFPCIRAGERRILIPREALRKYLENPLSFAS